MQLCVFLLFSNAVNCYQSITTNLYFSPLLFLFCLRVGWLMCASARTILNAACWFFWIHVCYVNTYNGWCGVLRGRDREKNSKFVCVETKNFPLFHLFGRPFVSNAFGISSNIHPTKRIHTHRENESEKHIYLEQIYSTLTLTDLCEKVSLFLRCWLSRAHTHKHIPLSRANEKNVHSMYAHSVHFIRTLRQILLDICYMRI